MTAYVYWLHPGASGSSNIGTEANPFTSYASCFAHLNAEHADIITPQDTVTVFVIGAMHVQSTSLTALGVESSPEYPLTFFVPPEIRSPGRFDLNAPGFTCQSNGTSNIRTPSSGLSQFYYVFDGMNLHANGVSGVLNHALQPAVASFMHVRNAVVRATFSGTSTNSLFLTGTNGRVSLNADNVVFDNVGNVGGSGVTHCIRNGGGTTPPLNTIANCTFINCQSVSGGNTGSPRHRFINNLFVNTNESVALWNAGSAYNATTSEDVDFDAFLETTQGIDASGIFVSNTMGESRLLTGSLGWGVGPADETYGEFVPQFDIAGNERTGLTTDVGAHQFLVEGGLGVRTPAILEPNSPSTNASGSVDIAVWESPSADPWTDPPDHTALNVSLVGGRASIDLSTTALGAEDTVLVEVRRTVSGDIQVVRAVLPVENLGG